MAPRWQRFASWPVLSVGLGLVLLVAVALKGHEIATEELLEDTLLTSRWFLILVVEWEIFFALWLLGGFYRYYPQTTRWVALGYFFALFIVAMDSVLKGSPSCACFGKAFVPPWIPAGFDLVAMLLLAAVPLPPVTGETPQRSRWYALGAAFSVFGLLSLITMADYSTSGAIPSIRKDSRFFVGVVTIQRVRPRTDDLLGILKNETGLNLTMDERLKPHEPDYGLWDLKEVQPWTVMELIVAQQSVPSRWSKTGDGYALVPVVRYGKGLFLWFGGVVLLALSMMGLRRRDSVQEREKGRTGDADREMKSLAALGAARCH